MDIRKISIGPDYKSSAMHYIVGQDVLNGAYKIHLIKYDSNVQSIRIWIEKNTVGNNKELLLWKEFNASMPIAIEYNINF